MSGYVEVTAREFFEFLEEKSKYPASVVVRIDRSGILPVVFYDDFDDVGMARYTPDTDNQTICWEIREDLYEKEG